MSVEATIMMIVILGGYGLGAFFLMSKVFKSQNTRH